MKKFILIYSALFLLSLSQASAAQFFETLYDVPIMDGLTELPDMAVNFDSPHGRIAEAGALTGTLTPQAIWDFYSTSLYQMGWQVTKQAQVAHTPPQPLIMTREGEKLSIFIEKSGTSPLVRFLLEPADSLNP